MRRREERRRKGRRREERRREEKKGWEVKVLGGWESKRGEIFHKIEINYSSCH